MYTQLSIQIPPHKYLEVINGGEEVIVLYSDDGSTIFKETHTFSCPNASIGFLTIGSTVETIITESASGSWDDRYTLDYTSDATEEEPVEEASDTPSDPEETTEEIAE